MFLFSIVPIHISGHGDQKPQNEMEKIEFEIEDLEGYLTAKTLGQEFDSSPNTPGVQQLEMPDVDLSNIEDKPKAEPVSNSKIGKTLYKDKLGIVLEGESKPFNPSAFGAGIEILLGEDLKPNMSEKEFREKVIMALVKKTHIRPNKKRIAAINTFITAIKNGISVPGYNGDGKTQLSFLLNLWKNPNQPLPIL